MKTFKEYIFEGITRPVIPPALVQHTLDYIKNNMPKKISMLDFIGLIENALKHARLSNNISVDWNIDDPQCEHMPLGVIGIGGEFSAEEAAGGYSSIVIQVYSNPNSKRLIKPREYLPGILREIKQVIEHESIHHKQEVKRNYIADRKGITTKAKKSQYANSNLMDVDYFGREDEIGAYSNDLSNALLYHTNNDVDKALQLLRKYKTDIVNVIHTPFDMYSRNFKPNSPVIKKLVKLAYQRLMDEKEV